MMETERPYSAKIMIVDDEPINVALLQQIFEHAGYGRLCCLSDPRQVLLAVGHFEPDIILLDLHMPDLDGFAVMDQIAPMVPHDGFLPIVIITADVTPKTKHKALAAGASDFVTKPIDRLEVLLRTQNLLRTRALHRTVQLQNEHLEGRVRERTRQLEHAHREIVQRLALAGEYRDDNTHRHTERVGALSAAIAAMLGQSSETVELLRLAAPLHDIGKIGIPDSILLKTDRLTAEEFEVMRAHTTIGADILKRSESPLLRLAEEIALTHHERWAGGGYPRGLAGEEIPLCGRIVAVADVFDALMRERPYKKAWPVDRAVEEIRRMSGQHFDPRVVAAFLEVLESSEQPAVRDLAA